VKHSGEKNSKVSGEVTKSTTSHWSQRRWRCAVASHCLHYVFIPSANTSKW